MNGMEHIMESVREQATSMEETSAAVVEISESIKNVAENVVKSIEVKSLKLGESSKMIGDILNVISSPE